MLGLAKLQTQRSTRHLDSQLNGRTLYCFVSFMLAITYVECYIQALNVVC
jgi:hypothetical protein